MHAMAWVEAIAVAGECAAVEEVAEGEELELFVLWRTWRYPYKVI